MFYKTYLDVQNYIVKKQNKKCTNYVLYFYSLTEFLSAFKQGTMWYDFGIVCPQKSNYVVTF